jgi:hypothetical protein
MLNVEIKMYFKKTNDMKTLLPKRNIMQSTILALLFLLMNTFVVHAQVNTTGQTIELKNGTGSGFNVGNFRTYSNILPISGENINAKITILQKYNVDSWTIFDDEGYPDDSQKRNERFQPAINFGLHGFVKFKIEFFEQTTSLPVFLQGFNYIGVDIDGNANSSRTRGYVEYQQITGYSTYDVQSPTDLEVSQAGNILDVFGHTDSYATSTESVIVNEVGSFTGVYTEPVSSFEFIIGIESYNNSSDYNNNPGTRYFSVLFGPASIQYNWPKPIATDDEANTCTPINADTEVLNAYSNDSYRGHAVTLGDTILLQLHNPTQT